jgi:hypothetical protein
MMMSSLFGECARPAFKLVSVCPGIFILGVGMAHSGGNFKILIIKMLFSDVLGGKR